MPAQCMPNLCQMFTQFIPNVWPIYAQFMPNVYPIYTQFIPNLCQFMPNLKSILKFELDMLLFFIFIRGFYAKIPCIHFLLIKNNGEIFKNKHTFLVPHF